MGRSSDTRRAASALRVAQSLDTTTRPSRAAHSRTSSWTYAVLKSPDKMGLR
jgi:hypothetical protein